MPRRSLLTPADRTGLLAFPTTDDDLIRHYTFSEPDLSVIRQRRGNHNRLGFAVQLCYLRYPGFALPTDAEPPASLLNIVGRQLRIEPDAWPQYAQRPETRREHLLELQAWLNLAPFAAADYHRFVHQLAELAQQTDRGLVLAEALVELLRQQHIILPAIEAIIPWEVFTESITQAELLAQPESFDFLALVGDGFNQLRRYTPVLLGALTMKAAPVARELLAAVDVLKGMNERQARKVPDDAPTSFVRKRWENLVRTEDGLDRRYYELCVLAELKNSLRCGDIWVQGSRQFKDFEDYLLPPPRFAAQRDQRELGLAVETDCERFLEARLTVLQEQLATVERLAAANELPDAAITSTGRLKISPLDNGVPDDAEALMQQSYSLLPHLKITELLLEVDGWTGFSRHFKHLKSGAAAEDQHLLLTTLLADVINLGLSKMAESCPGVTYAKLTWLQAWHIRDETYSAGLAELVNAQFRQPFAAYWGDGTTSSSDGQNFKAGGRGHAAGQVNLKYGQEPGVQFYTHICSR
jgi:hypothetical protein